ncbi:hypothetical protein DB345_12465 [Spartobacteria bacterium LR76]|nr:hypothetical protein DB345_12465 [Spartobacteria bacterium LR76]
MKRAFLPLLVFSFSLSLNAAPKSPDDLRAALQQACSGKDRTAFDRLICMDGLSESDKTRMGRVFDMVAASPLPIDSITLVLLPAGFETVQIANGKMYEPNIAPLGGLQLNRQSADGNTKSSSMLPYGTLNGEYYLVASKATDLGWKGPKDQQLNFMVMGQGQDKVKIKYRYNVSGVSMERTATDPSIVFLGQYIESLTVTSDSDATDVTLSIREDGKEIYASQPLKGKGTLEYKRP